jgi:hypothetical protein
MCRGSRDREEGGKANQRVAQAFNFVRIFLWVYVVPQEDGADRLRPLVDNSVKVFADHVGRRRTNLHTFRAAAVDQRSEQFAEQFFYRAQLIADYLEFCGGCFDGWISRSAYELGV